MPHSLHPPVHIWLIIQDLLRANNQLRAPSLKIPEIAILSLSRRTPDEKLRIYSGNCNQRTSLVPPHNSDGNEEKVLG